MHIEEGPASLPATVPVAAAAPATLPATLLPTLLPTQLKILTLGMGGARPPLARPR